MSLEQIKRSLALPNQQQQAELISYLLRLHYSHDAGFHRELTDRLNDRNSSHWLTPDEFERRLDAP